MIHVTAGNFKTGDLVKKKDINGPVMIVTSHPMLQGNQANRYEHTDKYMCQWQEGSSVRFGLFKSNELQPVFIYYPRVLRLMGPVK